MLTIGEFSKTCFVTKKTLRHYDEIGLLQPAYVAENGYRYYTVEQIRTMRLISRLKSYGFSLPEISAHLANPDEGMLARKIAEKQKAMKDRLESAEKMLHQMEQDIEKLNRSIDIMEQNITVKLVEREPQTIFGIRKSINMKDYEELMGELFREIELKKITPQGAPMSIYHDEDYSGDHCDIELAMPVADGTPEARRLEGGQFASSVLTGPYEPDAFKAIYAGLVQWIDDNGYHMIGAPFDIYTKGGPSVDPQDYITEIFFPVAK